jgi:hypothetical protein
MNREVTCPGCSQTFDVPDALWGPRVKCPHCQTLVLNLRALQAIEMGWREPVGVMLGLIAVVGAVIWLIYMVGATYLTMSSSAPLRRRDRLIDLAVVAFMILPCGLVYLSGKLFFRAEARSAGRGPRTLGAVAALVLAVLLLGMLVFVRDVLSR